MDELVLKTSKSVTRFGGSIPFTPQVDGVMVSIRDSKSLDQGSNPCQPAIKES